MNSHTAASKTALDSTFSSALFAFLTVAQGIIEREFDRFPIRGIDPAHLETEEGSRYIRVVRVDRSSRSAHCFVDKRTGAVLKAASWRIPAKHARGNIFDADHGAGAMTPFGCYYLRLQELVMSRKRPPTQRSKGRGSHGVKARYKVHKTCIGGCGRHQPIERLDASGLCSRCRRKHYPTSPPSNRDPG